MDSYFTSDPLVASVTAYVKSYMSRYDPSHDVHHVDRVVRLAHHIHAHSPNRASLDLRAIHLAALLHDVGDKKYLLPDQDGSTMVFDLLVSNLSSSCPKDFAQKIQDICLGVSYSSEVKDPERVRGLIERHPELAVVQDADRLDAIGAVGIGRMFTFGGAMAIKQDDGGKAKGSRSLDETMKHLDEKLVQLEEMMKTDVGRMMARERTERLEMFKGWWGEEVSVGEEVGVITEEGDQEEEGEEKEGEVSDLEGDGREEED